MKTQQLKIQVPEPCHEDWNKMTPKDKGAFCSSCEKVVVDFTKMTDRQLLEFVEKNKGKKTCGKFNGFQLDRKITVTTPKPNYFWTVKQFFVGLLVSLSFPGFTKAENIAPNFNPLPTIDNQDLNQEMVKGLVVSPSGHKISGAYVRIYQDGRITKAYTVTDETGTFSMELPKNHEAKKIELKVTAQNYRSVSTIYNGEEMLELVLHHDDLVMGKMAFNPIEIEEKEDTEQVVVPDVRPNKQCESIAVKGEIKAVEVPPTVFVGEPVIDIMGDIAIEYPENFLPQNITGAVVDENGESVPFTNVLIKDTKIGTTTDLDGNYSLDLPAELQGQESLTLIFQSLGFEDQERVVNSQSSLQEKIVLNATLVNFDHQIMGIMIMAPPKFDSPSSFDDNYQEPEWKEAGYNSRKEWKDATR